MSVLAEVATPFPLSAKRMIGTRIFFCCSWLSGRPYVQWSPIGGECIRQPPRASDGFSERLGVVGSDSLPVRQYHCEPLPDDLTDGQIESLSVVHSLPAVMAECPLIQITKQVERFYAHVGSAQCPLQ
jgi:hypothetical protein